MFRRAYRPVAWEFDGNFRTQQNKAIDSQLSRDRDPGGRVTWSPGDLGEQTGRTFVVTGASSGIGFETARALVGRGAHVVLAVRNATRGETAASQMGSPGSTSVIELELADLDQVAGCAKRVLDSHDTISALICNAGVMGGPFLKSVQGFELQMATNHLGHAALIAALWPLLNASSSRVVVLSSNEAKGGQLSATTTRNAPAGFAQLRGVPELAQVYPSASDPVTAGRLWKLTEEVIGQLPASQGAPVKIPL